MALFKPEPKAAARGGWQQRSRADDEALQALAGVPGQRPPLARDETKSVFARGLLLEWGWGDLSGPAVRRLAGQAVADGLSNRLVKSIAALGSEGRCPGNIERDLFRKFAAKFNPDRLAQPLVGPIIKCFLPPHELFGAIAREFPAEFAVRLGARRDRLAEFWQMFRQSIRGREYFDFNAELRNRSEEELSRLVPVVLHCDAGPYTKKKSCYVLSWGSLLGVGSEQESTYLIASWIDKKQNAQDEEALWPCLAQSLAAMSSFRYPLGNLDGTDFEPGTWRDRAKGTLLAPAADGVGFGAVLLGLKADLEWYTNSMGWQGYNSAFPCGLCRADRLGVPWHDPRETALWRTTVFNLIDYRDKYTAPGCHPVNHFVGVSGYTVFLDLLHICDYRGITSLVIANTLWGIVQDREIAHTQEQSLAILNAEVAEFYSVNNVQNRLPEITVSMLIDDKSRTTAQPQLKGPTVKAANTRSLLPYVAELARRKDTGTPKTRHRRKLCEWLQRFYDIVYTADMFLTGPQKMDLSYAVQRVGLHYLWLSTQAIMEARVAWGVTPKVHYFLHIPLHADILNPRFVQTYKEEGFVGRCTTLYASCANGPYWPTIQLRAIRKYLVGLQVLLSDLEADG